MTGAWLGAETSLCLLGWWDGASGPTGEHIPPCLPTRQLSLGQCCPWSRQAVLAALALSPGAFTLKHFLSYLRQTKAVFLLQTSAEQTAYGQERG